MNSIYFLIYETRREHFAFYQVCWKSLLSVVDPAKYRLVVPNIQSSPELIAAIPTAFNVRNGTMPEVGIHRGTSADVMKWAMSMEGDPGDGVLFLDSRDLLFQRDPFADISEYDLIAAGEGATHGQCEWNARDQGAAMSYLPAGLNEDTGKWPVVCAGVMGGRRLPARAALMSVWLLASTYTRGGTDQAAWNYIWNKHLKHEPNNWLCDPNVSDWCLHGHHLGKIRPEPRMEGGQIISGATGRPYALVHQWDRTPWRDEILRRWTGKTLNIITPVSRPDNLPRIRQSILTAINRCQDWQVKWYVVFDAVEINPLPLENAPNLEIVKLASPSVVNGTQVSVSGNAQRNLALDQAKDGWVYFLDDDTVFHPDLLKHVGPVCSLNPGANIIVSQSFNDGSYRMVAAPENVRLSKIDSGQALLTRDFIGTKRWQLMRYEADGVFLCELYQSAPDRFQFMHLGLCVYNVLR